MILWLGWVVLLLILPGLHQDAVFRDFPGGPVVKTLPAQCKGHRFNPWSVNIPHAAEQLSLCAAEPVL